MALWAPTGGHCPWWRRNCVLWRYDGASYCTASGCRGWIPIGRSTDTAAIVTVDAP